MAKGWAPRNCAVCGERVLRPKGYWNFNVQTGQATSLHHGCVKKWYALGRPVTVLD
jgi:hypothetical protein